MRALLILIFLLPGIAIAQEQAGLSDEIPYAAVFSQAGLPDFKPLQNQIKTEGRTAIISLADSDHTVSFVWGKNSDGKTVYWVLHRRADNTVSLDRPSMQPDDYGTLSGNVNLYFDPVTSAVTPLRLRLLPQHQTLLYRWPGSSLQAVGGAPAVETSPLLMGEVVPDFAVQTLDGNTIKLSDLKGKLVVINWWATFCKPCIAEMPGLNMLVEKYGSEDVVFLALAMDTEADLRAFLEQQDFLYQQALATEATNVIFGYSFPRNVIVDANRIVVYDETGGNADIYKKLEKEIAPRVGAN